MTNALNRYGFIHIGEDANCLPTFKRHWLGKSDGTTNSFILEEGDKLKTTDQRYRHGQWEATSLAGHIIAYGNTCLYIRRILRKTAGNKGKK